jgi:exonuclease VII large subunit
MAGSADDLILKMQHLEAQARNSMESRALRVGLDRLKSAAQKLAWNAAREVHECETIEAEAARRLDELRVDGITREEAPEFIAVKQKLDEAKKRLVKARAQLNFALDQMTEVERREYEAFQAEVRAETHGALADDLAGDAKLSSP